MGTAACDMCGVVCSKWVDGKTIMGPWANMCQGCYKRVGVGLGIGKGQLIENGVVVQGGSKISKVVV